MEVEPRASWRDEFVLSRDYRALGRHSELISEVRHGRLVPVVRGAFRWADARTPDSTRRADDDYLSVVRATALLSGGSLSYSHLAAAVVWELPFISPWPDTVAVVAPKAAGGRSNSLLVRSSAGVPIPVVQRDGLHVTSLARTVVDVARTAGFAESVAVADAALHGPGVRGGRLHRAVVTPEELADELIAFGKGAGVAKCRGVLDFADGRSDSAGESLSRAGMRRLGLSLPELQVPFFDSRGLIGVVDFWWSEFNLIGEFDGYGKYVREEFAHGRTMAQILMEEKERENRLRALGPRITRWGWATARSLPRLDSHLRAAGVR